MLTQPKKYHISNEGKPLCQCTERGGLCYFKQGVFYKSRLCRSEDSLMMNDICDDCWDEWVSWASDMEVEKQKEDHREDSREEIREATKSQRKQKLKDLLDRCG